MSILEDIQRADLERRETRFSLQDVDEAVAEAVAEQMQRAEQEFYKAMKDKIVLDPKLDPDPFGAHGIALVDRLKAMGWP